jgi:hypothetical protein
MFGPIHELSVQLVATAPSSDFVWNAAPETMPAFLCYAT